MCGVVEDYVYPFIHRLLIWVGRAGRAGGHPMNPSPKMAPPKPTAALHAHGRCRRQGRPIVCAATGRSGPANKTVHMTRRLASGR